MKFNFCWEGKDYDCEWFDELDFENLDNVVQAYGFVFDDEEKICIVNVLHNDDGWSLPGGSPEDCDENLEATLIREVDEEADLDIKDIKRIGYIRVFPKGVPEEVVYMVRYIARVDKIKEQSVDPACKRIPLRKFVSRNEFLNEINWGVGAEIQLKKAIENFEKGK